MILRSKALCQQSSEFDEDADLVVSIILSISLPGLLPGYTIYRILWEGGKECSEQSKKNLYEQALTMEKPFVILSHPF